MKIFFIFLKQEIKIVVIGLLLLMIFVLIIFSNISGDTSNTSGDKKIVQGEVVKLISNQTEVGNILYLIVKLENGESTRVKIAGSYGYSKGKKVRLNQIKLKFFGTNRYVFLEYID